MIGKIALVLFYLLSPAAVLWACNKWKVLNKIGPVLILYFLGIIVANLNLIPADCAGLQDTISTIAIPLALPMMLYSCNFKKFSVKTSLKITIIGIVAVAVAALVGFFAFRGGIGEEAPIVGAAVMGKCTGGTPNLAALKVMLNMENSTFIILNSFDMVICFFYLVMLMTVGIKWGRKWLGRGIYTTDTEDSSSYGALTLTCEKNDQTVSVRTAPLQDADGKLVTADVFSGKTIDVNGLIDYFDLNDTGNGTYQIKVYLLDDIDFV